MVFKEYRMAKIIKTNNNCIQKIITVIILICNNNSMNKMIRMLNLIEKRKVIDNSNNREMIHKEKNKFKIIVVLTFKTLIINI